MVLNHLMAGHIVSGQFAVHGTGDSAMVWEMLVLYLCSSQSCLQFGLGRKMGMFCHGGQSSARHQALKRLLPMLLLHADWFI